MDDQLAKPIAESERLAIRQAIRQLHPGNRFRLMAGLSMLPEKPKQPLKSEKPA